jgi:hypothetical protein
MVEVLSPPKEQQNHAHFEKDGDVEDSGDIFHTGWMGGHNFFL